MDSSLRYFNEDDKCYGATGMAIGIVAFDGEDMLSAVSLDAEPGSMLEFVNEFYFSGNPGLSAKSAWNAILKNFNLSIAMSIANVMCRSMVLNHHPVRPEVKKRLSDCIHEEGRDTCALDDDEINRLFDKNYTYLMRVFNHQGVQSVANEFAAVLKRRRRMSRADILEQLSALGMF